MLTPLVVGADTTRFIVIKNTVARTTPSLKADDADMIGIVEDLFTSSLCCFFGSMSRLMLQL